MGELGEEETRQTVEASLRQTTTKGLKGKKGC